MRKNFRRINLSDCCDANVELTLIGEDNVKNNLYWLEMEMYQRTDTGFVNKTVFNAVTPETIREFATLINEVADELEKIEQAKKTLNGKV